MTVGGEIRKTPGARRKTVARAEWPAEAWAVLALFVELETPVYEELLLAEAVRLVGPQGAVAAIEALTKDRLIVEHRDRWDWGGPKRIALTPEAMQELGPEVAGLLARSGPDAPPDDGEPTAIGDPSARAIWFVAAVATQPIRTTDGRLYRKDAERLAKMLCLEGHQAAQDEYQRVLRLGLVAHHMQATARWGAADEWSALAAHERGLRWMSSRRHLSEWATIVAAAGAWIDEESFARRWRASQRERGRDASAIAEARWREARGTFDEWAEVERRVHDGHRWMRLRPAFAVHCRPGPRPVSRLHVQANFEVIVPPEVPVSDLVTVARACDLRKADVVATFALTAASVRRAAKGGLGPRTLLERLAAASANALPDNVVHSVRDWAGDVGRMTVGHALLLRFDDEAIAGRAIRALGQDAERIAPTILAVDPGKHVAVRRTLDAAGLGPRDERELAAGRLTDPPSTPTPSLGLGLSPDRVEAVRRARRAGVTLEPKAGAASRVEASEDDFTDPGEDGGVLEEIPQDALWIAIRLGADVQLGVDSGTIRLCPVEIRETAANDQLVGFLPGESSPVAIGMDRISSVSILVGTSRGIAPIARCPCGSGRRFKHCCRGTDKRL